MMDKKRLARWREFVEELSIGEAHLFLDLAVVFRQDDHWGERSVSC